ncbi:MAG: EmrB/QacA family drug resistance transporter, partial [Verrucomicrobiota bacterium]
GQPLIMVPLTAIATSGIEPSQAGNASSLFNMMRNLGGSVGIALGGMLVSLRERFHSARLGEAVSEYAPATQLRMTELTTGFMQTGSDVTKATWQALLALQSGIRREAYVMAYEDCFLLLGAVLLLSITTIWCCKNSEAKPPGPAH